MKRLNKKTGIAIFTAVMAILAVIILVYHNPLANPQDELLKKVIACVLIVAAIIAFIRLYDKITVLPVESPGGIVMKNARRPSFKVSTLSMGTVL